MSQTSLYHNAALIAYGVTALVFFIAAVVRRAGTTIAVSVVLAIGAALNVATLAARGAEAGHVPLQTNFEALTLTALCLAIGFLVIFVTNKLYAVGAYGQMITSLVGALTSLSAVGVLMVAQAKIDSARDLPPALQSPWFVPHVVVYIFGYGTLGVAFCSSVVYLVLKAARRLDDEAAVASGLGHVDAFSYRVIAIGFPFLSAGLIFGALWAQEVWATYWGWDSKEVWSLITWLVYLIYLHLRRVQGWRGARSAWFVILGAIAIIITFQLFGYLPASATSVHKYG